MSQYPSSPTSAPAAPAGSGQLVVVGIVIAVVAVILMNIYVEMRVASKDEEKITFFRFADDYEAGKVIESGDVKAFQIPISLQDAFGLDAIGPMENNPREPADGLGYPLMTSVVAGEILRSSQITSTNRRTTTNDPKDNDHQITLRVDQSLQPPNLVPSDRIDLWAAVPLNRAYKTMLVMEYVEVAAVGEQIVDSNDGQKTRKYRSVTINVKPQQVSELYDIMRLVLDREFRISRRAPTNSTISGIREEAVVNPEVLKLLRLSK